MKQTNKQMKKKKKKKKRSERNEKIDCRSASIGVRFNNLYTLQNKSVERKVRGGKNALGTKMIGDRRFVGRNHADVAICLRTKAVS